MLFRPPAACAILPPMQPLRLSKIVAKSGLSRAPLAEPFLVSLYRALAPYRGCAHGCLYCDGRAEKYYVEGQFDRDIAVRANLAQVVAADVAAGKAAAEFGAVCFGSGVTDAWQPVEAELGLTRSLLEALQPAGLPVVILTKNALVRRDFDLLKKFPKALVIVTLTTTDPETAALLEPEASTPEERLQVVREARAAGFSAGIMAMPLCPGLSDQSEQTAALFDAAQAADAQFVFPGGLTLRPGCQKQLFIDMVQARRPALLRSYSEIYAENRVSGMPLKSYAAPLQRGWELDLARSGMPARIPWTVYKELLCPADSLFVLLCHMQELYSARGVNIRPLKAATDRYAEWLRKTRASLRRDKKLLQQPNFPVSRRLTSLLQGKRSEDLPLLQSLEENDMAASLGAILQNERLAALCAGLLNGSHDFDYCSLQVSLAIPAGTEP